MTITKTQTENTLTIVIEGRIDTVTSPQLESEVVAIENASELVFDFKDVEYISSAGLRVILKAQKKANQMGGKMKLVNVNDDVMDVFDITGFLDILTIE